MAAIVPLRTDSCIAVGSLSNLGEYWNSKFVNGLPADFPMLDCPVERVDAHCLSFHDIRTSMCFGHIKQFGTPIMTIRLQLGSTQFYWLADMTDPEVWRAYDKWKYARRVPIALESDDCNQLQSRFCVLDVSGEWSSMEEFRIYAGKPLSEDVWKAMVTLSVSGLIQLGAKTDIPGVQLEHVFVNVLLTKRLEPFLERRLRSAMPRAILPMFGVRRAG
ncbi:hypothetical protein WJ61_01590 [Burkholderia ubonensis]|nr:hypothetical protein WJ61_01590 [Burkholderia ubonensis]